MILGQVKYINLDVITGSIKGPYICGDAIDIKDNLVLTGSCNSDYLQLWDLRNLKSQYDSFEDSIYGNIYSAQFGKNNFGVGLSSVNSFRTYNLEDYSNEINLEYIDKAVYTIHFSYNGEYCALSGADSTIKIIKV
jgi:WD40 repeat protein